MKAGVALGLLLVLGACARSVTVPFDAHRNQVAIQVDVKGEDLRFLVDTAVTPSALDLMTARRLDLVVDPDRADEAAGIGSDRVPVFEAKIAGARIGGAPVEPVPAAAFDMTLLSERYGMPLHGILGDAYLTRHTVLIDYPTRRISFFDSSRIGRQLKQRCSRTYEAPLVFMPGTKTPQLMLAIAGASIPVTLDTGSSVALELFPEAVQKLGLSESLSAHQAGRVSGARGDARIQEATLNEAIRLGPFEFRNVRVSLSDRQGSAATRLGNLGNALLQNMTLLIDYTGGSLLLADGCHKDRRS